MKIWQAAKGAGQQEMPDGQRERVMLVTPPACVCVLAREGEIESRIAGVLGSVMSVWRERTDTCDLE